MIVRPIQTSAITKETGTIFSVLDSVLQDFKENEILVVTSKIVSICEGRLIPVGSVPKDELVAQEADAYLPRSLNVYGVSISIKHNTLIASAGIDESNGNGYYVLWPEDPQRSVNQIRDYIMERFSLSSVGVIMTDSHLFPLRWGTVGTAITYTGFEALNNYIGTPDIFGRPLHVTMSNVAEGLAAAAVVTMGEGSEKTPLAVILDIPFVHFVDHHPTPKELEKLHISKEEDVFAPFFASVPWQSSKK